MGSTGFSWTNIKELKHGTKTFVKMRKDRVFRMLKPGQLKMCVLQIVNDVPVACQSQIRDCVESRSVIYCVRNQTWTGVAHKNYCSLKFSDFCYNSSLTARFICCNLVRDNERLFCVRYVQMKTSHSGLVTP